VKFRRRKLLANRSSHSRSLQVSGKAGRALEIIGTILAIGTLVVAAFALYVSSKQADIMDRQTSILAAQTAAAQVDQVDKLREQVVAIETNGRELFRLVHQLSTLVIRPCTGECAAPSLLEAMKAMPAETTATQESKGSVLVYTWRQLPEFVQDLEPKMDRKSLALVNAIWSSKNVKDIFDSAILRCAPSHPSALLQPDRLLFLSQMASLLASSDELRREMVLMSAIDSMIPRLKLHPEPTSSKDLEVRTRTYTVGNLHDDLRSVTEQMRVDTILLYEDCMEQRDYEMAALHTLVSTLRSTLPVVRKP